MTTYQFDKKGWVFSYHKSGFHNLSILSYESSVPRICQKAMNMGKNDYGI